MATGAIHVVGLKELTRDFKKISKDLDKLMVKELTDAADPVKDAAESSALTMLRNMSRSTQWADMRVGVSRAQGIVYIVPQQRGGKRAGRENFGPRWQETVEKAAESRSDDLLNSLGEMIDRLGGKYDLD